MKRLALLALVAVPVRAGKSYVRELGDDGRTQTELYLDPYYSALNLTRSLVADSIPRVDPVGERAVYLHLVKSLPRPREVLVEASINPLPVAGWEVRRDAPGLYDDLKWGGFQAVQALTEGFPEPWAVSLFFGNVVNLVAPADTGEVGGTAYAGVLFSAGLQHLHANRMVGDPWLEAELKIKGDDTRPDRRLGWSFRLGTRRHGNPRIDDSWYVSLVRRRTDFRESGWNWRRNGNVELRLDLREPTLAPLQGSILVGKKWPFAGGKAAFSLNLGAVRAFRSPYHDRLFEDERPRWRYVVRPNLEF